MTQRRNELWALRLLVLLAVALYTTSFFFPAIIWNQDIHAPGDADTSARVIVDSSADWGKSDMLAVPKTAKLAEQRGIPREQIELATYKNALAAYSQSGQIRESDWLNPEAVDQRTLFEGNSVLRGGQPPRIDSADDTNIIR